MKMNNESTDCLLYTSSDPKLKNIINRLEADDDTVPKYYHINIGILFVKTALNKETWKVIIPNHIEKEIIIDYHIRSVSYTHLDVYKRQGTNKAYLTHTFTFTRVVMSLMVVLLTELLEKLSNINIK